MDQLKPILQNAYKYRFWIICGLVVSLSLVFSFVAASSTRAQIKREKDAIKASFDQVSMLQSKENPPNDTSHKAMEVKISAVKEGVREAWEKQYDNQNSGPNKLVWPTALGKDFINEVLPLHPIEKITIMAVFPFDQTAGYQWILDNSVTLARLSNTAASHVPPKTAPFHNLHLVNKSPSWKRSWANRFLNARDVRFG